MPKAPKFTLATIGPGIVLIAMGLGSGEFVLWPYLIAQFGFGIIWGAILGITFQYFVSNESGRYTLATGNSVYQGFYQLNRLIPLWFIFSTFISFAWPGIIGAGGKIIGNILQINDHKWITIFLLIVIGLLLTFGGKVYNNLERMQKLFVLISLPLLIIIAALLFSPADISTISSGFIGIGEGYTFIPASISIVTFLGAVAYSGAGGNLVISHSFYLQDEGAGMSKELKTQIDPKVKTKGIPTGKIFDLSESNIKNFKDWFSLFAKEQFVSFWFFGLITILLLAYISFKLVYPFNGEEGLEFIFLQSEFLSERFSSLIGLLFLVIGAVFLFTTQLGIFESTSRIMTENLQLYSQTISLKYSRSTIFYFFLWSQIAFSVVVSLFALEEPLLILILGTFFSAVSMFVLSGLILWLNSKNKLVPSEIQPGIFRKTVLLTSFIFFGIFVVITLIDIFL